MRRPSFQFYPADWTGNSNLRRCTHAERGVWIEVMCLMHDQAEYGILRWPLAEIAEAAKCKVSELRALARKAVLKGADDGETCEAFVYVPRHGRQDGEPVILIPAQPGPIWYSSRMVKDEYVRSVRGESTRFPGDPEPAPKATPHNSPKAAPKGPFGDGSSSSSSSSNTVPKGTGGKPPSEQSKTELWHSALSLLAEQGMPEPQARPFIGKLAKDYPDVALDAVRAAVAEQPADARAYLRATCQRLSTQAKGAPQPAWAGAK